MRMMANIMRPPAQNVLLIAKKNKRMRELELHLAEYFHRVCLVSDLKKWGKSPLNVDVNVIVVTDSFGSKLNGDFLFDLRKKYPGAKMLYLYDKICSAQETAVRTAGAVFVGSYDQFFSLYDNVLQSALESKKKHFGQFVSDLASRKEWRFQKIRKIQDKK